MKVLTLLVISFIFIGYQTLKGQDIILQENFNGSVTGWTVVDGNLDDETWFIYDAGSTNLDGTDYVMVNSDAAGAVNMDEKLYSPKLNTTGYTSLSLEFDQYFRAFTGNSYNEKGDVDVWDGSQWVNVYRVTATIGAWSNPNHRTIDISSYANDSLQIRFRYYNANFDWYWALDNVEITGTLPSCPTASFNNIETASPYSCGDTINLAATGYNTSGEYITPGFNIYITTDIYSDDENSLTIYKNGQVYYEVPVGSVPANTEWNLWGQYMDPTATWSFEWCDSYSDGTFPYEVYDNMSGQLITSGTIDNVGVSCRTLTIGTLDGVSTFIGTGLTNNGDGTATLLTSNITPGNYEITFYYNDSLNCSDSTTQNIVIQGITADAGNNQAICQGDTIEIGGSPTASGGNNISYLWSPNTGLSSSTVANPQCYADTTTIYTLIVTDSNCGADTSTITITVNPTPTAHAGADQSYCAGDNVTLGANPATTGGTTPYNYSWTPTTGLSSGNVANPTLVATSSQNYILNISDANNCTNTDNIQITIYNQLTVNAGTNKNICQGKSVNIGGSPTASGGTMPYSYNWMPSTGLDSVTIANPTTSTSTNINYTVEVTDSNGCTATDTININVISNQDFIGGTSASYTTSGGRFLDSGGESGNYSNNENYTITFNPCDDTKKIQLVFTSFSIQYHSTCLKDVFIVYNGPNTSSPILATACGTTNIGPFTSSHSSGALTVKFISDGNTIGSGWIANINQACVISPTIEAGAGQSICNGENIQLGGNPTATGGYGAPYTYNWTPVAGLDNANTSNPTASPDSTTTYTLVVTDKEGCNSLTDNVEVLVSGTNEQYKADHDATYYVSGGSFMDGGGSGDYSNFEDVVTTLMPCGDYKRVKLHFSLIDIETNINCSYDWLKIYDGPDTNSTLKVMLCGDTTSYDIIATNPTGALTFQFHSDYIVNGAGWNSQISLECQPPKAVAGANKSTCNTGQEITLGGNPTASGGSQSGYTYNWSPATGLSSTTEANPTLTINSETHYYLTVTDGNGCESTKDSIYIYIADTTDDYIANGNGEYYVNGGHFYDSGGQNGDYSYDEDNVTTFYPCHNNTKLKLSYTEFDLEAHASCNYDWMKIYDGPNVNSTLIGTYCGTNSPGNITSTHSTGALTVVFHSDYSITGAGWKANISHVCNQLIADAGVDKTICSGDTITIGGSPSVTGGSEYLVINWTPSTGLSSTSIANPFAHPSSTTSYIISLNDSICGTDADTVFVTVLSLPVANAGTDKTICFGDTVSIGGSPAVSGGSEYMQFHWEPSVGLNSTIVENPFATPSFSSTYRLLINDSICGIAVDSILINVLPIPEAFAGNDTSIMAGSIVNIGTQNSVPLVNYLWYPETGLDTVNISGPIAAPDSTTLYSLVANNACGSDTDQVLVTVRYILDVSYVVKNESFDSLGEVTFNIIGGEPPYYILWNGAEFPIMSEIEDQFVQNPGLSDLGLTPQGMYDDIMLSLQNNVITEITTGIYQVSIVDSNDSIVSITIPVGVESDWADMVGVSLNEGALEKTADDGWGNAKATSYQVFTSEEVGSIYFETKQSTDIFAIGFRNYENTQASSFEQLSYGLYMNNGVVNVIDAGISINNVSTFTEGDKFELKIEPSAGLKILKNNENIYTVQSLSSSYYLPDVVLYKKGIILKPIILLPVPIKWDISAVVTDANCANPNSGSIDITIKNSQIKSSINWNWTSDNGYSSSSQDITGLQPGEYSFTLNYIFMGQPVTITKMYRVGIRIYWDNVVNVELIPENKLNKNSGVNGEFDGLASSNNVLETDISGWIEFTFQTSNHDDFAAFGLKDVTNNNSDIIFGFMVKHTGNSRSFKIIENGLILNQVHPINSASNKFAIKRNALGQVTFYYNNTDFTSNYSNSGELDAAVSIATLNTTIDYTKSSFGCYTQEQLVANCYVLKRKLDGGNYHANNSKLLFKFDEEYYNINGELNYNIYDNTMSTQNSNADLSSSIIKYGDNRYELNVGGLIQNQEYILEVENEKGEKWYLRFKKM